MHPTLRRFVLVSSPLFFAAVAYAHPGHDGHELTWDLSHLAAHPIATLARAAVAGLGGWALWRAARAAGQSFRGSQARRGK